MKIVTSQKTIEFDIFGDTDAKKMPSHMFHNAVHLNYDAAIRADITKQAPATCPRHWYVPAVFECADCKAKFDLSIAEQKFWYEDLKFFPDVTPIRCAPCRKKERKRKLDEQKPKKERA